ncbi:S41 family peptidase [Cohnella yongneupensis]|uniref:S41 family peptidase n=1 Tax=Cohnella yongneupensis TaxID=425006 RepID=UPI003671CAAD
MVLTAVATGMSTYAALRYPGFLAADSQSSPGTATASPELGITDKELSKFNKAFELIRNSYLLQTNRAALMDGAIQGMVESLNDPYSVYKSPEESEAFSDELQGAFTGIGANLSLKQGTIVVESTFKGSPAERAGLLPKDVLLSVNGESLQGLTLSEAVAKIRGPKGTKAKLNVRREGVADPLDLELVRDRIDLVTVHSEMLEDGIGYLAIRKFTFDTSKRVADEIGALEQSGLKALVIDLRDNPGGMVQSVEEVASQLLPKGKSIMQYQYRDGTYQTEVSEPGLSQAKPYPIVVLVNKGSASAAEILAGAMQQSANAVLVGETTYGKGTVQLPFDAELEDGSIMKLTVSKWLLPDGTWINGKGISPDVPVVQPDYFMATQLPRDAAMKLDDAGPPIANLQAVLEGVGFPADRHDGYFSQATQDALEAFQKHEGLPVTGIADTATSQRLEEVLNDHLQQKEYDKQLVTALAQAHNLIDADK